MGLHNVFGALLLFLAYTLTLAQSTTVLSLTSTTTIHATATDNADACNNFYGACVVYGDGDSNGAPYTTTVYRHFSPSPTEFVTSTTLIQATTTATDASACRDFEGACVVYAGNGDATYTTTAAGYHAGQAAGQQALGNSDGYIAMNKGRHPAAVGAGASLAAWTWLRSLTCICVILGTLLA